MDIPPTLTAKRASAGRPTLTFITVAVTAALLLWAHALVHDGGNHGLTPIFSYLFAVEDAAALKGALWIALAAALISKRLQARALLRWIGGNPGWVAVAALGLLSCGAWIVYRHAPLSMDEYSAVFQSRVFAAGHLAGQFPQRQIDWLIPRGFQNYFLNVTPDGLVTSGYWPSFALLLTPFTWLGIPWMCNPALSALTVLAVHRLAMQIFAEREAAGMAVLLTVASPVFFANGISYYSMSAHLLANTLYASLLAAPTFRKACAAGLIGSVALTLHNPVPHMLFALPWIVALLHRSDGSRLVLALFAGYLPLCLLLGLGWFVLTSPTAAALIGGTAAGGTAAGSIAVGSIAVGSIGTTGIAHLNAPFAWPTSGVMLARAIGIAKIWAWSVPGLMVVAAVGAWKWRHDTACRLLTLSALLTVVGYAFVPFDQGHGWGYRYFHSAWMALPLLAAAAVTALPGRLATRHAAGTDRGPSAPPGAARTFEDGATQACIAACALFSLFAGTGLRAVQIHRFVVRHESQWPAYAGTEPRVVILDTRGTFYGRDLVQNDPWLRGDTIVMITHGPQADGDMMRANYPHLQRVYADRYGSVWSAVRP
ncbi:MAG: hypothetical protein M3O41_04490 [Pseudomonadota bacterium]|nr:hypothetical protein [Pseudomonadota bacterium]